MAHDKRYHMLVTLLAVSSESLYRAADGEDTPYGTLNQYQMREANRIADAIHSFINSLPTVGESKQEQLEVSWTKAMHLLESLDRFDK